MDGEGWVAAAEVIRQPPPALASASRTGLGGALAPYPTFAARACNRPSVLHANSVRWRLRTHAGFDPCRISRLLLCRPANGQRHLVSARHAHAGRCRTIAGRREFPCRAHPAIGPCCLWQDTRKLVGVACAYCRRPPPRTSAALRQHRLSGCPLVGDYASRLELAPDQTLGKR